MDETCNERHLMSMFVFLSLFPLILQASEIKRLNKVYISILEKSGVQVFEGRGMVLDPHTVEIRGTDGSIHRLSTRNILIATGGHAVKLNIPGAEHAITSDEALVVDVSNT